MTTISHRKVKTQNARKRKKEEPFFAGSGALLSERERDRHQEDETLTSNTTTMRFTIVFKLSLLSAVILSSFEASSVFAKSGKAHDHDRLPGWHGEIHSVEDTIAQRKQESRKSEVLRTSE